MLRDEVVAILKAHYRELRERYHVQSLDIFGSVARGDDHPGSDVDVLVSFSVTPGIFTFIELKQYLEKLLNRKVDLVTHGALKKQLREQILREMVHAA